MPAADLARIHPIVAEVCVRDVPVLVADQPILLDCGLVERDLELHVPG
ncbi:MAG: hypothetical protein ACI8PZ_007471, partial [Myxococcota bacterium]